MKVPFVNSFSPDQPLREAVERVYGAQKKITKVRADAESRRAERGRKIAAQATLETVDMEQVRQCGELEVLAGIADTTAVQIHATLPGLVQQVDARHYQLTLATSRSVEAAAAAVRAYFRNQLAPHFSSDVDSQLALDRAVETIVSDSEPGRAFHFHDPRLSIGAREGSELADAERLLETVEQFQRDLKRFAALLPKGFAPYPGSAAEMDEKFPLPVKAATSASRHDAEAPQETATAAVE